jgi:Family of unknown function (DUF6348)
MALAQRHGRTRLRHKIRDRSTMASFTERVAFRAFSDMAAEFGGGAAGKNVSLPELDLTLSFDAGDKPRLKNVLAIDVIAQHDRFPEPIRFSAVGFGDDHEAAAASAAQQWFQVVYPVLDKLIAGHDDPAVETATIASVDRSSGQRFGWRVILGPVRVIVRGDEPPAAGAGEILHAIKRQITGVSAQPEAFWVDAFVAIHDDGSVAADCRYRSEPWDEATERLGDVAVDLLPRRHVFRSWRQFLYFDPAAAEDVAQPAQPWWKRVFRRGS